MASSSLYEVSLFRTPSLALGWSVMERTPRCAGGRYRRPRQCGGIAMRLVMKPAKPVRVNDQRSVFKSLFLRESVFRKPVTSAEVKAGLRSKSAT